MLVPEQTARKALAAAFAQLLSYPHEPPAAAARRCAEVSFAQDREAGRLLAAFAALAETEPLGALQEAYTSTFDLDTLSRSEPTCYPYVGHYLFDESHKRGAFIVELRKRFRAQGFEDESDLADHLVVLLRFLAECTDDTLADEIVDDAILVALRKMRPLRDAVPGAEPTSRSAYLSVLTALELALGSGRAPADASVDVELEREWLRDRDSLGIDRDRHTH